MSPRPGSVRPVKAVRAWALHDPRWGISPCTESTPQGVWKRLRERCGIHTWAIDDFKKAGAKAIPVEIRPTRPAKRKRRQR